MKPSPLQTPRAIPSRGRSKDAGVLLSRRSDSNSVESKIPKIAAKSAFEEPPADLAERSAEEKRNVENLLESPISNLLLSFEAEDEDILRSGEFDGGSPVLFPVKEEEIEKVGVPINISMERTAKVECPTVTAETLTATNSSNKLVQTRRSMDSSHGSKDLLDAVVEVAVGGGLRATDGRSGLTLVRISLLFFLIGWVVAVNILAVSAVFGGRCDHNGVFSGLPPT